MNTVTLPEISPHVRGRTSTRSLGFWAICLTQFMTAFVDNAFRIGIIALAVFMEVKWGDAGHVWKSHTVATISTFLFILPAVLVPLATLFGANNAILQLCKVLPG